jgi:ABC-type transport system involved in cytochrome c biogenesis permease subunit
MKSDIGAIFGMALILIVTTAAPEVYDKASDLLKPVIMMYVMLICVIGVCVTIHFSRPARRK